MFEIRLLYGTYLPATTLLHHPHRHQQFLLPYKPPPTSWFATLALPSRWDRSLTAPTWYSSVPLSPSAFKSVTSLMSSPSTASNLLSYLLAPLPLSRPAAAARPSSNRPRHRTLPRPLPCSHLPTAPPPLLVLLHGRPSESPSLLAPLQHRHPNEAVPPSPRPPRHLLHHPSESPSPLFHPINAGPTAAAGPQTASKYQPLRLRPRDFGGEPCRDDISYYFYRHYLSPVYMLFVTHADCHVLQYLEI